MQPPARAIGPFALLILAAGLAACHSPSPPAPPIPWLVEVSSIEGDGAAGLSRCGEAACEAVPVRALLGPGKLRVERGSRATLALDLATSLAFADGTEIELTSGEEWGAGGPSGASGATGASGSAPSSPHAVRVVKGAVRIVRRGEGAIDAPPVALVTAGRSVVVPAGSCDVEARAESKDDPASVVVDRGKVAVTAPGSAAATWLRTGEGARFRAGTDLWPLARWAAPDDAEAGERARESAPESATATGDVRGLGKMTARVPGTEDVVSGVRLAVHRVNAEVRDGFARTTVEEEFENETSRTLEGRFVFPLPPDASISRLALWVGDELVEGEIVDRPLAGRIFKAIVDDTVRPRDPAILEHTTGSSVSLKIFPIPAKGRRRVLLTYDQPLTGRGERARYVYPLSLGADRATTIDDFSIAVTVKDSAAALGSAMTSGCDASLSVDEGGIAASYSAKRFAPASDFVLRYSRTETDAASLSWSPGPKLPAAAATGETPAGYFALRLRAEPPEAALAHRAGATARAFVIDASHSQSAETFAASVRVATTALAGLDPEDRFTILACDSACDTYPEDGLARASDESLAAASDWLARRTTGGSSDLAGALLAASSRLAGETSAQLVYLGDGVATSGEIGAAAVTARVAPALRGIDAHLIGVGHSIDELALSTLAASVSGTYERLATGDALAVRAAEIARNLDAPVMRDARLVLPRGAFDVIPATLPRVRLGQEVTVFGRFRPEPTADARAARGATVPASWDPSDPTSANARDGAADDTDIDDADGGPLREVRLEGDIAGQRFAMVRALDWDRAIAHSNPAVHALWARAKIASLETSTEPAVAKEIVRLSTVHHVLSRSTALLVLENERMFVETGVRAAIDRVLSSQPANGLGGDPVASNDHGRTASRDVPIAPFGNAPPSSSDPMSARGNMWGDDIGSSFGAGGLGLSGVGSGGGGGRGEGIGLGGIGTIGHGAGTGPSSGFGSGTGRLSGTHKTSAPRVRMAGSTVSGRLPPEVIQRIVRQNFGRFRLCYEKGLTFNPNLTGRVAVRFIIDATGNVTNVANGGSDLPDASVVSCVVRSFQGLAFPQPEGGIVTVVFPITFAPADDGPGRPMGGPAVSPWGGFSAPIDGPIVAHRAPADAPAPTDDAALAKLLAKVADPSAPRAAHHALIRKLLSRGQLDDAFAAASRYIALDPDHDVALELFAQSAAATNRPDLALRAVDAQLESDPSQVSKHRRAAAAFEAAGDERRACAHFRAVASLPGAEDGSLYQALRCRARLGERAQALSEARSPRSGPLVRMFAAALETGSAPAYDPGPPGATSFEAHVTCRSEATSCPVPVVITPSGTVVSPWTPPTPLSRSHLAFAALSSGTYRTLLLGPLPPTGADLTVKCFGQSKSLSLTHPGPALSTTLTLPTTFFN